MSHRELTVVVVGDRMTGKTALVQRFTTGRMKNDYQLKKGADAVRKRFKIDNEDVDVKIWDVTGQYRTSFHAITKNYFRGATGIIVTFSMSGNDSSLGNAVDWKEHCSKVVSEDLPCVLVGTKSDQAKKTENRIEEVANMAGFHGWYQTSAKTGNGVTEMFESLTRMMIAYQKTVKRPTIVKSAVLALELEKEDRKKSSCKC